MELSSLFEFNSSIPYEKKIDSNRSFLTPKISIRVNPSDMKNHKTSDKNINIGNIFSVDRLGLGDSYESGRSVTMGIDYKREINKKTDTSLEKLINILK